MVEEESASEALPARVLLNTDGRTFDDVGRITDRPCQFPTAEPADVPTTRPADDRSTPCSARQAIIPSSHAMPVMPPPPRTRACPGSGEHVRR